MTKDKSKSEDLSDAATKLDNVQKCSDALESPIRAILHKMDNTRRCLEIVQRKTLFAMKGQMRSYATAQEEAKNVKKACAQIQQHALSITTMKGQLEYMAKQVKRA